MRLSDKTRYSLSICLLLALAGCSGGKGQTGDSKGREEVQNVHLLKVTPRNLTVPTTLIGTAEAARDVVLKTEEGGPVEKIYLKKGQRVRSGQFIAEVNSSVVRFQVKEAKARSELRQLEFERATALVAEKAYPKQALDKAQAERDIAKSQLDFQLKRLDKSIVKAPFAGIVEQMDWEVGEFLQPGAIVAVLLDLDRIKIKAGVSEEDIIYFTAGDNVAVNFDSLPGREFNGRVSYVASIADTASRTYPVEVMLQNPGGKIKSGMVARLRAVRKQYKNAVVVPLDTIVEQNGKKVIFVADGERAVRREISVGLADGNLVAIESGLASGEWLVVRGQRYLADGTKLKVTGREE